MRPPLPLFAALVLAGAPAADLHVDAVHGDDVAGDGSAGAPFFTLTKALAVLGATEGETVHVAPGVYDPAHGEVFPLTLPARTTLSGGGAHHTIVSGEGEVTLLRLGLQSSVSDFTLQRSSLAVQSVTPPSTDDIRVLRRCILRDNATAVGCKDSFQSDCGVALLSCALVGNGIAIRHGSAGDGPGTITLLLYGTTITENDFALEFQGPGVPYVGAFCSIVRGNGDDVFSDDWTKVYPGFTGNVVGDPAWLGSGSNVDVDPGFLDPGRLDFHLTATSLVRDHAAPAPIWPPGAAFVDAALWIWESSFEEVGDLDGDPRKTELFLDPGCDEYAAPGVYTWFRPELGETFEVRVQSEYLQTVLLGASTDLLAAQVAGFLWLAPPLVDLGPLALDTTGTGKLPIALPDDPVLAGLFVHLQAVLPGGGWFTGSAPRTVRLLP